MSMTKRDLVVKIANVTGMLQSDVAKVIQMTLDGLVDELAKGGNVELRNFGVFEIVTRKGRPGRNPNQPTQKVMIPERTMVKFRAGKELKGRVLALKKKLKK